MLPYARQTIDDDDIAEVVATLRSDWLTTGPAVDRFEAALAAATGARHAVACATGTAGLHIAAKALGLTELDSVIVPTITFLATANAVRFCGAEVLFSDVDPDTGMSGIEQLDAALSRSQGRRVRAVFPVHLAGQCGDPAGIYAWARKNGLSVVEDACHALGTTYEADGQQSIVGACDHSDMAVFSFHPAKTVTTGEGGAVTTASDELAGRLQRLRNHGITRTASEFENSDIAFDEAGAANPWYYEMREPMPNYRASDIACALGFSQLRKLDRFVARRTELVAAYDRLLPEALGNLAPLVRPLERSARCQPGWHLYPVLINFAQTHISRSMLMKALLHRGIGTQVHYIPVHLQPYYRLRYGEADLPGANAYYAKTLSLPLFPAMEVADVERVVAALAAELRAAAR